MDLLERAAIGLLASGAIALFALTRGSLSRSGAGAALVIGTASYLGGGLAFFLVLLTFFVTSTLLGKVGKNRKAQIKLEFEKGDTRDAKQALANGGVAALCALGMLHTPHLAWAGGFVGALATANADTWATELGTLSRREPWSLRTLMRVPRGTSGAVSGLGLGATLCGGALLGGVFALSAKSPFLSLWAWLGLGASCGVLGALVDSACGAAVQAAYFCRVCAVNTEAQRHHCGNVAERVHGLAWFDNDAVNLAATLSGAALGALVASVTG